MRVPLLDLSEQYRTLAEPIREAIDDVLTSHRFILGPKGEAFEKAIGAYCKARSRHRCFIRDGCFPGHFDGAWNRARRCRCDNAVHIFCHGGMHRTRWRQAAFRRYRSGNLQPFVDRSGSIS